MHMYLTFSLTRIRNSGTEAHIWPVLTEPTRLTFITPACLVVTGELLVERAEEDFASKVSRGDRAYYDAEGMPIAFAYFP